MINETMGASLSLLNRFAGSPLADKLGLQKPAQKLVYQGVRGGFQAGQKAAEAMKPLLKLNQPERIEGAAKPKPLFDLSLTEEQQMIRESLAKFADDVLRPAAEEADEKSTPPADLFASLDEMGLRHMAVPEALGGMAAERSPVSNMLVIEDLARGDMGLAYAALAPLGVAHALGDWGTAEQQATYLAPFAADEPTQAAMALLEPGAMFDPYRLETVARATRDGFRLKGEKCFVALGETARFFLVAAAREGRDPGLFLVERDAPGLTIDADPAMGLRAAGLARLRFDDVELPAAALLGGPEGHGYDFDAVVDRGRIAWATMAVGTAQSVLEYVITYCNERIAFGEPISHRQSVAFMIADIGIELEGMRLLCYRAASRAEQGKDYRREAALAKTFAADKAMKIGTDGVQLLGGHGFVKEHPVERWYRHLRATAVLEGGLLI